MNGLEQRYRRVLRMLPASYRETWEDDMVATFLQSTALVDTTDPEDAAFVAEYGTPGWAEIASVLALAVRLRLGGAGAPPRYFARGEALRRVALVGLLLYAVTAVIGIAQLWLLTRFPHLLPLDAAAAGLGVRVATLAELLWVAAYLALVTDHRRVARVLATLAIAPQVASYATDLITTGGVFALSHTYQLLLDAVPVAALVAWHPGAPPIPPRPWLLAFPAGLAVVTALTVLAAGMDPAGLADWPGLLCVLVLAAGCAYLLAPGPRRKRRAAPWSLALIILTVAVLGPRVVSLLDYLHYAAPTPQLHTSLVAGAAEAVAMLGTALVLAALARRDRRDSLPRALSPQRHDR